ncbi:unnamed protein product [Allacma fusca]|uniref:protein-tyrosine-phosphatase n=1 Tax=Allacma fusca TaxID=39272 RepID=A0A8J2PW72_9HEXA|nr:unnamed protein product [Allacma fusca]
MALRVSQIRIVQPIQLTNILKDHSRKVRLIDCRSFLEFNDNHIIGAVNICCSKLIKRRLQQDKISLKDLLLHCRIEIDETSDVIVYDQRTACVDDVTQDSFLYVLLKKLIPVFGKVCILAGGFVEFEAQYPELCENMMWKYPGLTALSQPCLPTTSSGPTRILPFLYLGSEEDANNRELLQSHNITYELNVSNKCPKPDFIPEGHFMRIPVNDSHNEKLLPYFAQTFQFVEKVRKSNECALVHCLAGISRSPTVAIAYVMRHLMMSCEDAYRYVKSKRATISPNFNFLGQLLEYEQQLISEKVLENKVPSHGGPASTSQPHNSEFFLGPQVLLSPTSSTFSQKSVGKRVNLSLRISPFAGPSSLGSPKDASPTTAMARLQFEKPLGKENRTASSSCGFSPCSSISLNVGGLCGAVPRPTRLVKEQNVTSIQEEEIDHWGSMTKSVTRQSVSISISKGFKSRKSSLEQYQQQLSDHPSSSSPCQQEDVLSSGEGQGNNGNAKKCRVHNFVVEGSTTKSNDKASSTTTSEPTGTQGSSVSTRSNLSDESVQPGVICSPLVCNRDYLRSDSVSTSGIGSEISDHDLLASGSWDMTESGGGQDDGVFSDSYSLYSKSPKSSRQLQLWSSDSGHWSSADEGAFSSCSSSTIEVPAISAASEAKSPEKRKCSEYLFPSQGVPLTNFEKRRSYAGGSSSDWIPGDASRSKRWSLAEDSTETPLSNIKTPSGPGRWEDLETETKIDECTKDTESEDKISKTSSSSSSSHLNFGHHWFNLLSGRELTCCERQGDGLYRVQSCPGICGHPDWLQSHNQVPESPPEPISDSALLKMRTCRNRSKHLGASDHPGSKNRFSCGSIDYDELWSKLRKIHDSKTNDSHSSSSTLASSSYSIVVQ